MIPSYKNMLKVHLIMPCLDGNREHANRYKLRLFGILYLLLTLLCVKHIKYETKKRKQNSLGLITFFSFRVSESFTVLSF